MFYLAVKVLTYVVFSCLSNTTCSIVAIMQAHPTMSQQYETIFYRKSYPQTTMAYGEKQSVNIPHDHQ